MFERFKQRYTVTFRLAVGSPGPIVTSPLENTPGYEAFMREYAGATFNEGLYRVHALEGRARWNRQIGEAFPLYKGRFSAFGCDWMGRQFALDAKRREEGQPLVLMFEPGTGLALKIPGTFQGFHDKVLVESSDAALADGFFRDWRYGLNKGPGPAECIGYKMPLFLSGADSTDNLELTEMDAYWENTAGLLEQTRDLPDGTPFKRVKG